MRIHFYLHENDEDDTVISVLQDLEELSEGRLSHNAETFVAGFRFKRDEEGVFASSDTFLGGVPSGLRGLPIRLVTLYEEGEGRVGWHHHFEEGETTAYLDSFTRPRGFGDMTESYWRLRVRGPSFDEVVDLYKRIRRGEVSATEAWQTEPPVPERPPGEEAVEA